MTAGPAILTSVRHRRRADQAAGAGAGAAVGEPIAWLDDGD
jgi:hypothetical protein